MDWKQVKDEVYKEIQPGHIGILKCRGNERRKTKSNNGKTISMMTGKSSSKTISYDMIHYAYSCIESKGIFDSKIFRKKFQSEYSKATCRYSMVGGILVAIGFADRMTYGKNSCIYREKGKYL